MVFDWPIESSADAGELLAIKLRTARLLGLLEGQKQGLSGLAATIFAGLCLRRLWAATELALQNERAMPTALPPQLCWLDRLLDGADPLRDGVLACAATLPATAQLATRLHALAAAGPASAWQDALDEAGQHWTARKPKTPPDDPFAALAESLGHASRSDRFAEGRRDYLPIPAPGGATIVAAIEGHRAQSWALALTLPAALPGFGLAGSLLPLAGGVPRLALRQDLHLEDRCLGLCEALIRSAAAALSDIATAQAATMRLAQALPDLRTSSRAPQAYALIVGLDGLRRHQLAALLGLTLAGVDQALARLTAAGLIARRPGDPRGAFYAYERVSTPATPTPALELGSILPTSVAALEEAMAALDALLPETDEAD